MTEQQLIFKLKELKQIQPRKDWVVLSKMAILESVVKEPVSPNHKATFSTLLASFYQRKLVYALASFLFIVVGVFGLVKYQFNQPANRVKFAQQSTASLVSQNDLKSKVEELKAKSQNLAEVIESKSQNTSVAIQAVKEAAKHVTDSIKKDPTLAKVVALDVNNSRVLLNIPGGSADVKITKDDVYKTIDDPIIASIKDTQLTKDQQMAFNNILNLYDKGDYSDALVRLLISFGQNGADGNI